MSSASKRRSDQINSFTNKKKKVNEEDESIGNRERIDHSTNSNRLSTNSQKDLIKNIKANVTDELSSTKNSVKMKFELFAPTISNCKLLLDENEYEMTKQSDGKFVCDVNNLSDGQHKYKFRIVKKGLIFSSTVDVVDPYARKCDPDEQFTLIEIKNGELYLEEYQWKSDHIQLPSNEQIISYELYVADFSPEGTFDGIMKRLDYLLDLGINAIELLPLMGSEGREHDWGYLPRHYFSIKSTYGTMNDFKHLVDQCHKRGIRVFLDAVFNHSDEKCPLAQIDKEYWYYKGKHHPEDPYYWGPEFNYEFEDKELNQKPAAEFIIDVVNYWIGQFHLDGIRFDAAKQMDNFDILRRLDKVGRSARLDQPFLSQAEYVPETKDLLKMAGGPVDTCWSSSFHETISASLTLNKEKFCQYAHFPNIKYCLSSKNFVNYLSCHDNERLLFQIGKTDEDAFRRMKTAATLLLTSVGIPMIWQGEEFGENRDVNHKHMEKKVLPMQWHLLENDFNRRLFKIFKSLIKLRREKEILQRDNIHFFYEDQKNRILCYSRSPNLVLIINFDQKAKIKYLISNFPQSGTWRDYFDNQQQIIVDQQKNLIVDLLPLESKLYVKDI